MNQTLTDRLNQIKKVVDISGLLNKHQDNLEIKDYYNKNKIPYLLFHNYTGYLHMGISNNGQYNEKDLEVSIDEINQAIQKFKYLNIVELGSGRGANAFYIASRNPRMDIRAVDFSTSPLAKYKGLKNLKFIKGDFHDLSFLPDQSVDLIFGIETFCHSEDKIKLFSEIYRVLRPDGRLYIFDGYRTRNLYSDENIEIAAVLVEHGMAVNSFETVDVIESKAIHVGFTLQAKENLSKNVLPTMNRFERMARKFYNHPRLARIVSRFLPEKFIRNSIAGYLMASMIEQEIMVYYKHIFIK